jgi:hypothetical protein
MEMELAMATKLLLAAEYFGLSQNSAMVEGDGSSLLSSGGYKMAVS